MSKRQSHVGREPDLSVAFENDRRAPSRVRQALSTMFDEPADPIAEDVKLVASELVSNVVQHTNGGGVVNAWDPKPDIPFRLEVVDEGPERPAPNQPRPIGGHGLNLVDQLSVEWGIEVHETGKTVWVEFDRTIVPRH